MKAIPRLTPVLLARAEKKAGGMTKGWYQLCRDGYTPDEIALYTTSAHRNDVRTRVAEYARDHRLPTPASCAPKRQYVRKVPEIEDYRGAFRTSAMKTGLALVLSQPMLEMLCATADDVRWDRGLYYKENSTARPDSFIATRASLRKRGLIDNDDKLTPIGNLVVDVLKAAGVFVPADLAIEQKASS